MTSIAPKLIDYHRRVASGRALGPDAAAARIALAGLERIYRRSMTRRMEALLRVKKDRAGVPVVSVGNITAGGTGKTPIARHLAARLARSGFRVGVAMRGYGRKEGGQRLKTASRDVPPAPGELEELGDEAPLYLNGEAPADVALCRDRRIAVEALKSRFHCNVVLLDDGFQYLTLFRELDLVVLDAFDPFGCGRLLPRGFLREPVENLARADLLWLNKCNLAGPKAWEAAAAGLKAGFPDQALICSNYFPKDYTGVNVREELRLKDLQKAPCAAFCGVGNPDGFYAALDRLGVKLTDRWRFPDHHRFDAKELDRMTALAKGRGARALIVTEKDANRLTGMECGLPLYALRMRVDIFRGEEDLESALSDALRFEKA